MNVCARLVQLILGLGLGKDELEGNKEALMRRVNYKQHASKASRIFQSGPAWVG